MSALDGLREYLASVERRLRMGALARGAAVTAAAALGTTVACVLLANRFAFSEPSVLAARVLLFLGVALALTGALILPLVRLNRWWAARETERRFPAFEERLLTVADRLEHNPADPFLPLLAADSLQVASDAEPASVAGGARVAAFAALSAACAALLVWLGVAGPGFLGYGTALLWGGVPRGGNAPFYDVQVEPGSRTVRKRSDQIVRARLVGFRAEHVRLLARYASASKWEAADMRPQPDGPGYDFVLAGLAESLDYYVEAGGVKSKAYRFHVVDLPAVKRIRVRYRYPAWTGMPEAVEDPGGDLRAVEGTVAEVQVETDRPLGDGALVLDDGRKIPLRGGAASVPVEKDGLYHVAALEQGENVRLSEDYFIEAQKDTPPVVRVSRPGRDAKVSPIEEVAVALEGQDDFGLQELTLHYSVNAGPEKTVPLLPRGGAKTAQGTATIYLEDFKMAPGDIVSLYATARDARATARTDMYFLEAQPFEREYTQSQQAGGGGGGDPGEQEGQISQRQKEIIAATWNQIRDTSGDKGAADENARFLAGVQGKLRDQARSLVNRMRSRQLAGANQSFKSFVEDMDKAIEAMGPAGEKLKGSQWRPALEPEQKALQHLLRAEATFRNIQVAFGNRGGGGGGQGGLGRDLEGLFDLELDTEKNQYETGQQSASGRQKEIDEALAKLEQLAKRQQQLAEAQRRTQQAPQQRWEQEMLRREAEQLRREMEQLARGGAGAQSQQGRSGQPQQGGGQSQQSGGGQQSQQSGGGQQSQAVERAMQRLQQALNDMRQAASAQAGGAARGGAEARRAAERLEDARQTLAGLQRDRAGSAMDDLARRADDLARRQREFSNKVRRTFGRGLLEQPGQTGAVGGTRQEGERLADEKQRMIDDVKGLEAGMQQALAGMAGHERQAAGKLRQALGNMQQEEIAARMKWTADALRRGLGAFAAMREALTTEALDNLADQLKEAQQALNGSGQQPGKGQNLQEALAQAERLRQQMERALNRAGQSNGGQPNGRQGGQPGGQANARQGGQPGGQPGSGERSGGGRRGPGQDERGPFGRQGGGGPGGGSWSAMNRGDWLPFYGGVEAPRTNPEELERAYRDGLRDLGRLERAVEGNPEISRNIADLIREMQRIDPKRFPGNPKLLDALHGRILAEVEQVELELRRLVEEKEGGRVRSAPNESVPPGYAEAVAEYYRRLSRNP